MAGNWHKRLFWLLPLLVFLMPLEAAPAFQEAAVKAPVDPAAVTRRGLYVACDFFTTQEDTWPSSRNNIKAVEKTLSSGSMAFEKQVARDNDLYSVEGLRNAILDAFGEADANDVSYFYISTHGIYDPAKPNLEAGLLISDGAREEVVTARQLQEAFSTILGTKVLIIDACNSGAFIGKGVSGGATEAAFLGTDYKVLTSAGGSEESWYWSSKDKNSGVVQGASYFSSALTDGLGYHGEYGADLNRDGAITLTESYRYLIENHSASTPQSYPQEDDFVLFTYDKLAAAQTPPPEVSIISGITFYDTVLDANQNMVSFEFTVEKPVKMAYQLVYYRNGKWQFSSAKLEYDTQEIACDFGDQPGAISAGRKQRTLELSPQGDDTYGYVMVQLVTIDRDKTTVHGSRVLSVLPVSGDPELSVKTDASLNPTKGRELSILVNHKYPCLLSVSVIDAAGKTVKRLTSYQPTRPQQLTPSGSFFYWNGLMSDGNPAAPGDYTVKVTAQIGDAQFTAASQPFSIIDME